MNFVNHFIDVCNDVNNKLDALIIEEMASAISEIRQKKGRIFFIGVGGSAGNCSHAVNDFRKIAGIECYAPTDNVSELTARTNDEGWETVFSEYLKTSHLNENDGIFVLSVGGGDKEKNISANLVNAIELAKYRGVKTLAIVGKSSGYAARNCDVAVIIEVGDAGLITPISEAYQSVIWHLLVSHPKVKAAQTKWESIHETQE